MTKIIIVNEKDEIIGYKERGSLSSEDIYRVSALIVYNSKNEVLLAQRKFTKRNNPGKWGPAVAGTNDEGETYESNIIKEAEEEIGLIGFDMKKRIKERVNEGKSNYFGLGFETVVNRDISEFKIQEKEVEQIKWFNREEVLDLIKDNSEEFIQNIRDFI